MRLQTRLFLPLILASVTLPSLAVATDTPEQSTQPTALPNAMQHAIKAPVVDIANLRDPFSSYLARVAAQGKAALAEKQQRLNNRKRETLENFDLASLKLVAIFQMGGERVAMVEDGTAKGYIVRRGNYMGKHNGKIEKITDDTLFLTEQVLDPAGDIVNRQVTLTLNEVNE